MRTAFDPFSFLVTSIAGWMNEHQHHVIDYLMEENRVLREQIGNRRLRFSDDQPQTGSEGEKSGPEDFGPGGDDRHPGDAVGLAPKVNCQEIRRKRQTHCWKTTNRR